ncbi:MAG TPA: tetratricopeptide repeat protein [Methylophilus sp.]|nr:tetratricopeptide repeat protein [Methylophilus sp.]
MSLINQVLKDVEARQGGAPNDGWAGQQVKPVLSHSASASSHWLSRLIVVMLVVGVIVWLVLQRDELDGYYQSVQSGITVNKPANLQTASSVKPLPAAVPNSAAQTVAVNHQALDARPQLTKSLFSEWQAELSESVIKPAIRQKLTPAPDSPHPTPVKSEAPQVEGEFSIKPAESSSSATVVSMIEPPFESGLAGKKKASAETVTNDPSGTVSKHVRPEQEVNSLIQKAVDHEQKGRLSEALATLRQALVTYPQSEDARQLLAAYLFETKQEVEAVSLLQAGLKRYPEQVGLSKSLAKWQLSHNQPEAVLVTLKPNINVLARDAEAQWMVAIAHQQLNQHQAAVPFFERALLLHPGQPQWVVAYAISLQASGQNAQALQQLQAVQGLPLSDRLAEFVGQRIRQLGGIPPSRDD